MEESKPIVPIPVSDWLGSIKDYKTIVNPQYTNFRKYASPSSLLEYIPSNGTLFLAIALNLK